MHRAVHRCCDKHYTKHLTSKSNSGTLDTTVRYVATTKLDTASQYLQHYNTHHTVAFQESIP